MAIDKNAITKEAQKFAAKGQFDKAIAEWKKLVKESPNDANIFNTIGDLCLKKDAKAEAVDAYNKAADILASDGFTSKAIALYKKVLNIDPKKIEAHLALGDLNAEKGLSGSALESYKVVADHYSQAKEMVKALGIYQKMADLNTSNVAFRIKLADMYAKQGMKPEAIKAYLLAADVHVSKDAFKDARQLFEKVLALDPNNKEVYHKAGIVYFKEGKFAEACKALKPAFENDPSNQELVDTYLEALSKAGKSDEAEEALKKLLDQDPGKTELREKLYYLYLSKKDYQKALAEASLLANAKMESGSPDGAEEILKAFVNESPQYAHGHHKMAEFYVSVNRAQDAAGELIQAADILSQEGDPVGAKAVLNRALEVVPGMIEARERLERLETPAVVPPPQEPVMEPQPIAPEPAAAAIKMPPPAAAAAPASEETDPAVSEAFTEADVLIKYGLTAKAIEQLEALTSKFPESARIRIKLRDLYHEQGNIDKAVSHALLAAALYTKRGLEDEAKTVLQAAHEMAPGHPAVVARLGRAAAPASPPAPTAPAAPEESVFEVSPAKIPSPAASAPAEFKVAPPAQEPAPTGDLTFEGLDAGLPPLEEAAPAEVVPAPKMPPAAQRPAIEEAPVHARPAEVDISEIWAEAEFYFQQGLFDEAKKHYAKIIELTPGDKRAINRITEISREEEDTQEFTKLAEAVDELEGALSSGEAKNEMTMTSSDEDAVRSLMREIQEIKQKEQPVPPPAEEIISQPPRISTTPQKPGPPVVEAEFAGTSFASAKPAKKAAEEDFFDLGAELQAESKTAAVEQSKKPEDFFDLAAELRDELSNVPVPATRAAAPAEEQSLDDIFEEFKKGVEQQAVKEDADTHYNLGVAYKEMGLLDDAIAEFIMTPEDESKFIQSRYMLGLCYMEKGEYRNAIGEIQNALDYSESMGIDDQNRIEMHYDLGLAYQGAGNSDRALREFSNVYDTDPGYRDVADKVKELQQGDFISLEQLKDDIEKEISSKFFEEGERIEREEKTKKNEKIKG